MNITADYHVHSFLSPCGIAEATPENYAKVAKEQGLTKVGISDHMWDDTFPGATDWYKPLTVEHSLLIKERGVPGNIGGIQFLFGCEADMNKNDVLGLSAEHAAVFDYVMVSTSHFHMKGFTIDEDIEDHATVRKRMLERIYKVIEVPFVSGLSHPFLPLGFKQADALLSGFTDNELIDCFKAVAQAKKSLEINFNIFGHGYTRDENGAPIVYKRIFTLAREQGCFFHLGSDCHKPKNMLNYPRANAFAEACGITEDRFVPLEDLGKRK